MWLTLSVLVWIYPVRYFEGALVLIAPLVVLLHCAPALVVPKGGPTLIVGVLQGCLLLSYRAI